MTNPVQDIHIVSRKPLLDAAGGMTRGSVLHEDGAPGHPHAGLEMLLEDLFYDSKLGPAPPGGSTYFICYFRYDIEPKYCHEGL